jgi:ribokinase
MARAIRVLSIGAATQDVFLLGSQTLAPVRLKDGRLYEQLPLGDKLDLENVIFATGGNACNAAVTFARQGCDSMFMSVVGTEPAAQAIMQELDTEGVDTRHVRQQAAYRTAYSAILLAPNGERTILRYTGHKLSDAVRDSDLEIIAHADWLYVSSVGSMELLERIITKAARHKVKVAYNPSFLELHQPSKLRALLDDVTILIANKEEMQQIVEGNTALELVQHATHFAQIAVVSDGGKGAAASDGAVLIKAGIYENVPVVDRTGAGDAFGAGLTTMVAQGKSLEDAVRFASANATSVVGQVGAKAGILYKGAKLHDMPLTVKTLA